MISIPNKDTLNMFYIYRVYLVRITCWTRRSNVQYLSVVSSDYYEDDLQSADRIVVCCRVL